MPENNNHLFPWEDGSDGKQHCESCCWWDDDEPEGKECHYGFKKQEPNAEECGYWAD